MAEPQKAAVEQATLAGGCFWCLEAVFLGVRGVTHVLSGYSGGHVDNPSYEAVCDTMTGHAEVVQVTFDPGEIGYADLLRVFFTIHDPTTRDRQGNDVGSQYRSAIFTHDEAQRATAGRMVAELNAQHVYDRPIVTEVVPLTKFWPAEEEHHDYFARNPWSGYCRAIVAPKVQKFRKTFADRVKTKAA